MNPFKTNPNPDPNPNPRDIVGLSLMIFELKNKLERIT